MVERKKHRIEYILTMVAGIVLIVNSIPFIVSLFVPLPPYISLDRLRIELGEEGFRLAQMRMIISSIISGSMLIILAVSMERHPRDLIHYGIMTIIISIISLIGIGFINATSVIITLVAIVGGSIAVIRGKKGIVMLEASYKPIEYAEYLCSRCNIKFNSDEELRKHMLKHLE